MSSFWVRVDGVDGYSIGTHTAPLWETQAIGGCGAASLTFSTPTRAPHRTLRKAAPFQILYGTHPVYTGEVTEFDRRTGELHAKGMGLWLYDVLALDSGGASTRDIGVALTQAIVGGRWRGTNPFEVGGIVDGDADGNPTTIGALLDQFCEQTGQWWGTDAFGFPRLYTTPTDPTWTVTPDSAVFGETTEDSATFLAGRYDDGSGTLKTAYAGTPGIGTEAAEDLTDSGVLTEAQAEGILAGMLVRRPGQAWVNAAELTADQITTVGGTPAFLPDVTALGLMRSFGAGYLDLGSLSLSTVIGKTTYVAGAPTIRVEPLNTAPRTLRAVIAAA